MRREARVGVGEGEVTTALEDQGRQGEADEGEAAGVGEARGGKAKWGEGRVARRGERWARKVVRRA